MPLIIPIKEVKDINTNSEQCPSNNEPIFVTKNGYNDLVMMSMDTYSKILEEAETDAAITLAENEIKSGAQLLDAKIVFSSLRKKYFG